MDMFLLVFLLPLTKPPQPSNSVYGQSIWLSDSDYAPLKQTTNGKQDTSVRACEHVWREKERGRMNCLRNRINQWAQKAPYWTPHAHTKASWTKHTFYIFIPQLRYVYKSSNIITTTRRTCSNRTKLKNQYSYIKLYPYLPQVPKERGKYKYW